MYDACGWSVHVWQPFFFCHCLQSTRLWFVVIALFCSADLFELDGAFTINETFNSLLGFPTSTEFTTLSDAVIAGVSAHALFVDIRPTGVDGSIYFFLSYLLGY